MFDDFFIEPAFRKKGIARQLALAAQALCREYGIASLTVCCAPCDQDMYYDYASSKGKDVYCFIFAPNYNEIDTEKDLYLEKYKIVRYSEIYDFFKNPDFVDLFKDDPFGLYTQFVSALSMHIYRPDEEMERRFVTMINT